MKLKALSHYNGDTDTRFGDCIMISNSTQLMEEIGKSMLEKISSYNIFNNFFPGLAFCYMVKISTDYELDIGNLWENIFIYYFWGLIIGGIGSLVIENLLMKVRIRNKKSKLKENYIERAPYKEYIKASEKFLLLKS